MNLLIIGAGGHGKVVKEIVESIKVNNMKKYSKIDFLDDNFEGAVGKISELKSIGKAYDEVFCAIGNNEIRKHLIELIEEYKFKNATLIHEDAYVSPSATIGSGSVIEPKAVVNANSSIKRGCIISVGTLIDHDVVIEECSHINVGAICKAGSHVDCCTKIEAGLIIEGY